MTNEQIEAFKNDIKNIVSKYNFGKHGIDNYNGMEEYCGTDYYFIVDGQIWFGETIPEILSSVGLSVE